MSEERIVVYVRTRTNTQELGLEVQREDFSNYEATEIFLEQESGRKENKQELNKTLSSLISGNTLLIYNLSRLGRSSKQIGNNNE